MKRRGRKPGIPSYRHYKRTGQAIVCIDGTCFYLGPHGTAASRAEYDRLISEWLANGRRLPSTRDEDGQRTVIELIAAYWRYATAWYVKNGQPTSDQYQIRQVLDLLNGMYAETPIIDFGPLKLKAMRESMVKFGWTRSYVNKQTDRMKRMFRWGVENELVPGSVAQALTAVAGLRRGRTEARETEAVRPVPDEFVEAVKPFVARQVWGLIQVQLLTGCRPHEACEMRGCDLDMSGKIWTYTPARHKTEHHGKVRLIYLGPRAQAVVKEFLKADLNAHLFSPADAESERRAKLHAKRRTPLSCGNRPGTNRKRKPKRTPRDHYTTDSYRRAITRGCDLADKAAREKRGEKKVDRIVPQWHPHQLRHSAATKLRKEFGIEAARVILGHSSPLMTDLYAEIDRTRAVEAMARIG